MKKENLVSIIVPIYNVEKYLSKCIESIINQDYRKIEILLIVDGSPDNSIDICNKYKQIDKRINVISTKNNGVSSARNIGLKLSKGKYVVFVDADDWLELDFVSYMLGVMEKESCDFGIALNTMNDNNIQTPSKNNDNINIVTASQATSLLISTRVSVGCWNKIYSRQLLIDNNIIFNENQFYGEGLLFITSVSQVAKKIFTTEKKIYHYRQDNFNSATKKYNFNKYINGERSLDLIKNNLKLNDKNINKQLNIHYCLFYNNALWDTLKNNEENNHKEQYKYWKKMDKKYFKKVIFYKNLNTKIKVRIFFILYFPNLIKFIKKNNIVKKRS